MSVKHDTAAEYHAAKHHQLNPHEVGYHKATGSRQVQMITIDGAIGAGLFFGAGARLQMAGPALALVYLVCGIFSFFILRALGELVLHRPSSDSFISYAGELLGKKAVYMAGWTYFVNWAMAETVDITAVVLYIHYRGAPGDVPQWIFAPGALAIIGTMSVTGVKWFAGMELWFALVKVPAIVMFLMVNTIFLGSGKSLDDSATGLYLVTGNGGFLPHGLLPALMLVQGVAFAFTSIELVGTAAGECKDPEPAVPKAINSVVWRTGLFYIGSIVPLVLLLPWTAYQTRQNPFVTFFPKLSVPYIGSVTNIMVLTAALPNLNSGLYSTGRILRSISVGGSTPELMSKTSYHHIPYAGILAALAVYVVGAFLNYLVPSQVFETVLDIAPLGITASQGFIVVCQVHLRKAIREGKAAKVSFRMPGTPLTSWLTLLFLFGVLVLMTSGYPNGTCIIDSIPLLTVLLIAGWFGVYERVHAIRSTAPTLRK